MSAEHESKHRLFFALWPDDVVRIRISEAVAPHLQGRKARAVKVPNLHVTLAFLGSVAAKDLSRVLDAASAVSGRPFDLSLERLGSWRAAHVACVMLEPLPRALAELAAALRISLLQREIDVDRKDFRAHLTVARDWRDRKLEELIGPLTWAVRDFVLVESTLSTGRPEYRIVHRWPLHD